MISKSQMKFISSLSQKKFRDESRCFVAEGTKLVADLVTAFDCEHLFVTPEWKQFHVLPKAVQPLEITTEELKKMSNLKSPQGILAVFRRPDYSIDNILFENKLCLALDGVQDPGNLGTIIRIADWFGVEDVFCSEYSADAFGPKTVQATMGAISRVRVHYVNLSDFLNNLPAGFPVYGTFMDGENIYSQQFNTSGIIVMGNEGNGISDAIAQKVNRRLLIPNYPTGVETSESLNVAVATALVCAEFRRRM
ncbi:MAG: RNA methyltransferase [Paludibacteraceae bacterium]|nr:RNA methyltransferase [Paludibacteraceae bacterium]